MRSAQLSDGYLDCLLQTLLFPIFLLSLKQLQLFLFIDVCVCCTSANAYRGQVRVSNSPELELQVVVTFPWWMLGTELKSSRGAAASDLLSFLLSFVRVCVCVMGVAKCLCACVVVG